jgi:amino acid transporter
VSHHHKLSLTTAILLNLNVMFGTGIFINTIYLAQHAGFLGFLSYLLVAVLISPLIISMSMLLRFFPDGGFYSYASSTLGSFAGFISAWAYFTGKLASAALLTHVFSTLVQSMVPSLRILSPLTLDVAILLLFGWLVLYHLRTGKWMIYGFIMCKLLPILFAILSCLVLSHHWTIDPTTFDWSGIATTMPLVLFAFTGFEICCSLSSSIQHAAVNGPRAIAISFGFVVCTTVLYQLLFFLTVGSELQQQSTYLGIFPPLLYLLLPLTWHKTVLALLYAALATASLGGSYGILFSNHWNLYTLAHHNHVWGARWLTQLNSYHIPWRGVLMQIPLCIVYLLITRGYIPHIQQISVLGCIIAYGTSVLGLLVYLHKNFATRHVAVAYGALLSCSFFIALLIRNLVLNGIFSLLIFGALLCIGITMFATPKSN